MLLFSHVRTGAWSNPAPGQQLLPMEIRDNPWLWPAPTGNCSRAPKKDAQDFACPGVGAVQVQLSHVSPVLCPPRAWLKVCQRQTESALVWRNQNSTLSPARLTLGHAFLLPVKGDAALGLLRERGHPPLELTFTPAQTLPLSLTFLRCPVSGARRNNSGLFLGFRCPVPESEAPQWSSSPLRQEQLFGLFFRAFILLTPFEPAAPALPRVRNFFI